jgi:hypothetical protein
MEHACQAVQALLVAIVQSFAEMVLSGSDLASIAPASTTSE